MGGKLDESEGSVYLFEKLTALQRYKKVLGNSFKFITAPSREGPEKVYVQHRLQEHGHTVARLILQGAQIYICGDAGSMAREVHATLIQIMTDQNNMRQPDAERFLADMKTGQRYQVSFLARTFKSIDLFLRANAEIGGYLVITCREVANQR